MVESLFVKRGLSQGSGLQACASQFATGECVMWSLSFPHRKMGAEFEVQHCKSSFLLRLCDSGNAPRTTSFPWLTGSRLAAQLLPMAAPLPRGTGCGFYPSSTLSPHARAFSEHLSLLSASWREAGEGLEPCGAWLTGRALPELAEEWQGTWQMAGRAAPAPRPWVAVICHPHSGCGLGWQHPLASEPNGFYTPEEL